MRLYKWWLAIEQKKKAKEKKKTLTTLYKVSQTW